MKQLVGQIGPISLYLVVARRLDVLYRHIQCIRESILRIGQSMALQEHVTGHLSQDEWMVAASCPGSRSCLYRQ